MESESQSNHYGGISTQNIAILVGIILILSLASVWYLLSNYNFIRYIQKYFGQKGKNEEEKIEKKKRKKKRKLSKKGRLARKNLIKIRKILKVKEVRKLTKREKKLLKKYRKRYASIMGEK